MKIKLSAIDALFVIDMQNDFLPGGALAVEGADKIIPAINNYIKIFENENLPIFFTRDYHPKNHLSFKENGGVWPPHCVQGTEGAAFPKELAMPNDNRFIISKGTSEDFDAYSAFQGTILHSLLQERGIKRVFLCGVATDFCVKHTALGALHLGYFTFILDNAIKGVFDEKEAKELLLDKGAVFIQEL